MTIEESKTARIVLAAAGMPDMCAKTAELIWEATRRDPAALGVDIEQVLRDTDRIGAKIIVPGDDEWPTGLHDLARGGDEPLCLWVVGDLAACLDRPAVAIVGSRAATAYGETIARQWAGDIAEPGHAVVSGGAYGIDAAAHRGALAAGGKTVAVMAGGLDQPYPPGNKDLLARIGETGALVSERPPGFPPSRTSFVARNRLIAAMAKTTLVVEGGHRSGAESTASWATTLRRTLMAVPGPVTSAVSALPHKLVREGRAVLASDVEDVLRELSDEARP